MKPRLEPITLREARRFIALHHRHNEPPRGWLFGVAARHCDLIVGVGIAGRPISRELQDGRTIEVTRLCLSEAPHNTASMLYGALCRAARAIGYARVLTYTLEREEGASLRAAGFRPVARVAPRATWTPVEGLNRRQRDLFGRDLRPVEIKVRWERSA